MNRDREVQSKENIKILLIRWYGLPKKFFLDFNKQNYSIKNKSTGKF